MTSILFKHQSNANLSVIALSNSQERTDITDWEIRYYIDNTNHIEIQHIEQCDYFVLKKLLMQEEYIVYETNFE